MLFDELSRKLPSLNTLQPHSSVQAAVAMIVIGERNPYLLMIKRSEYLGDPWSGHMAFPGGRVEPEDESTLACAIRECSEEIALPLHVENCMGHLSAIDTYRKKANLSMFVKPYVFALDHLPALQPNNEVARTLLIPFDVLRDQDYRSTFKVKLGGVEQRFPCIDYDDCRIWGLSLRFIDEMLACID